MRSKFAALVGHVLHHYNTSIFGWTAPFMAPLLFPEKGKIAALLATFALLPLGYIGKPVGAVFWGWVGDRWGRKPALVWSWVGIAGATFLMGCLPLGKLAWVGLSLLKVAQGFCSAGGEKGAALYLLEQTEGDKRSWMSAVYDASGIIGIFFASTLACQWGAEHWRSLFWAGSLAAGLGFWLRYYGPESPEFRPTKIDWKVVWREKTAILKIAFVSGFSYANYYLLSVFLNGLLPQISSVSAQEALSFNSWLLWIDAILLLGFGALCRWIPREKMMAGAALSAALLAVPLFMVLPGASWGEAAMVRLMLVIFGVALAAPYHAWKIDIMPSNHRFLIGNIGSALGSKCFGAPMPALATLLVMETGYVWVAALPIVITGLLATFSLVPLRRTAPVSQKI